MSGEEAFEVEGRVIEPVGSDVYRVELPNGHRLIARCSRQLRVDENRVLPGDQVVVKLTSFDLSRGRIVKRREERT